MVFGRKKKRQKNDVKSADSSFTKAGSKSKVRRKPSFVSTPIKGRKMVKHRKSSGKRRSSKTIKSNKKLPSVPVKQQVNVAQKARVPPPPPIGQMNNRLNVIKSSMIQQQKQMMVRERQKHRETPANVKVPIRNSNNSKNDEPAATSTLSQSVGNKCQQQIHKIGPPKPIPRDRTKADLQKWLQWRKGVNDQLVGYVLSEDKGNHPPPVTSQFSGDFTADTIDSILHHAYNMEEPKSSLDKLSYMIYGIPRVQILPVVKRISQTYIQPDNGNVRYPAKDISSENIGYQKRFPQDHAIDNYKKTGTFDNENPAVVSRCSSNASGGRLPRRNIQGNLFIQTNPLHNIPRYLPEPRSAVDNGYHVPPIDYIDEEDSFNERMYNQKISSYNQNITNMQMANEVGNHQNMALNDNMNIYRPNDSISSIRVDSPPPRRPPRRNQSPAMMVRNYNTTPANYNVSEDFKSGTTAYPQPHSPISVNMKPPIAGAVPTLLSGLQPYTLPQLRHVSNKH